MTEETMTTENINKLEKSTGVQKEKFFKLTLKDLFIVIPTLAAVWIAHQQNIENIEKLNSVIVKYETQIDKMILADDKKHAKYVSNLKAALSSLSKEERKVLLAIYSVDK